MIQCIYQRRRAVIISGGYAAFVSLLCRTHARWFRVGVVHVARQATAITRAHRLRMVFNRARHVLQRRVPAAARVLDGDAVVLGRPVGVRGARIPPGHCTAHIVMNGASN